MIDLHLHSTASDGTLRPRELLAEAAQRGLTAIALTDHDTVGGLPEFLAPRSGTVPRRIPGIEIACRWYGANLHLVGLFIDPNAPTLRRLLLKIQAGRRERNSMVLKKLAENGAPISEESLSSLARGEVIGRPHFAQSLVAAGHCRTLQEAFDRFLRRGGPAYVRRALPLPKEAIHAIHAAGGVAVWAHPATTRGSSPARLRQVCRRLVTYGLDGIEVCYSEYSPREENIVRALALEMSLLPSGGSDFHGANSPGIAMGIGRGNLHVPDAWLHALEARAETYHRRKKPPGRQRGTES